MIWHTAQAKTIEDARRYETIIGTASTTAGSAISPLVLNDVAGTKFKIVSGYSGTEMFLAMERGETQARCMSWGGLKASKPDWLAEKKVNIVVQLAVQKHPELPDVPLVTDFASKPEDLAALKFMYETQEMGRPFLAPPGVPADRLAALRAAFDAMVKDPAFLEDARRSSLELAPISGLRAQQIIEQLYQTPKSAIARVEGWRASQ